MTITGQQAAALRRRTVSPALHSRLAGVTAMPWRPAPELR
jgi:hypothetical protein